MRMLALGCLAGLCFCLVACEGEKKSAGAAAQIPPPLVTALTLERADVPIYAVFMGQTVGRHSAAVKPQVTGILQERLFEEGAQVMKGAPLFRIDPAPFKAALEQARGQLASAMSRLENARRENSRVQKLYKSNAVSQQERDSARAAFLSAKAEVESARAAVDEARIRLGYTRVDAPLSGWTSREVSTVGSLVSPESTLTFISQNDPMDVEFSVPSVELFSMRDMEARGRAQSYGQGSPASLRLLEGVEYDTVGKVVFLDTQVEAETSAVRAKARFPNPKGQLFPGQFVAVRVGGASLVKAIMLPQEAVMQTESGPSVYVLDKDSRAERRAVVLGPAFGSEFLVESGLEEGQRVIVQGQDKVRAGQKVTARAMEQKGRNAKAGEVPALMAPGSSNSPSKRGNVEDSPAPVFEGSNSDSSVERKGGAR
ncbi:MAG: efflux RND transporter periplasmic adaptor subunit [Mailhella sp.]|nr:efflux RND transporter periplasmic adaptor subunit [Mailhella sp.]